MRTEPSGRLWPSKYDVVSRREICGRKNQGQWLVARIRTLPLVGVWYRKRACGYLPMTESAALSDAVPICTIKVAGTRWDLTSHDLYFVYSFHFRQAPALSHTRTQSTLNGDIPKDEGRSLIPSRLVSGPRKETPDDENWVQRPVQATYSAYGRPGIHGRLYLRL